MAKNRKSVNIHQTVTLISLLGAGSNKNVIAYKEAFFDEASSTLCIVMEFADGGDLYTKIVEH